MFFHRIFLNFHSLQIPRFLFSLNHPVLAFKSLRVPYTPFSHQFMATTTKTTSATATSQAQQLLDAADPQQRELMKEMVIRVDANDNVIGAASKVDSHLLEKGLMLHRAFSVFLFDSSNRLLLQRRAPTKVTFPTYWTNTCCSHPLSIPSELNPPVPPSSGDTPSVYGAKVAAIRKLEHELGIPAAKFNVNDFKYLGRIHYKALSDCGLWGEHEIDYILFCKTDVHCAPEINEVDQVQYVDEQQLRWMFQQNQVNQIKLTPWFKYIMQDFGFRWWKKLRDTNDLNTLTSDHQNIYAMGTCKESLANC